MSVDYILGYTQQSTSILLPACLVLGLFFGPEDEGDMFLRNVGWFSTDCMVFYPTGENTSA
jgi:hypothetical protein